MSEPPFPYCLEHDQPLKWCAHELLSSMCECGHSEVGHEIGRSGARTQCYYLAGPRGVQCTCLKFRPVQP